MLTTSHPQCLSLGVASLLIAVLSSFVPSWGQTGEPDETTGVSSGGLKTEVLVESLLRRSPPTSGPARIEVGMRVVLWEPIDEKARDQLLSSGAPLLPIEEVLHASFDADEAGHAFFSKAHPTGYTERSRPFAAFEQAPPSGERLLTLRLPGLDVARERPEGRAWVPWGRGDGLGTATAGMFAAVLAWGGSTYSAIGLDSGPPEVRRHAEWGSALADLRTDWFSVELVTLSSILSEQLLRDLLSAPWTHAEPVESPNGDVTLRGHHVSRAGWRMSLTVRPTLAFAPIQSIVESPE